MLCFCSWCSRGWFCMVRVGDWVRGVWFSCGGVSVKEGMALGFVGVNVMCRVSFPVSWMDVWFGVMFWGDMLFMVRV